MTENPGRDAYQIYHPGTQGLLRDLPRTEALSAYQRLMDARPERENQLRRLVEPHGVRLDRSDPGIQQLNDWFRTHIQPDPATPGRLMPQWYSVINDISLYLGDTMIERNPQLRWEFCTAGKKNISYQRHTITGFTKVPNPHYSVDIDRVVATYGHRIIAGEKVEPDAFLRSLQAAHERA